jgi:hypothetical protein
MLARCTQEASGPLAVKLAVELADASAAPLAPSTAAANLQQQAPPASASVPVSPATPLAGPVNGSSSSSNGSAVVQPAPAALALAAAAAAAARAHAAADGQGASAAVAPPPTPIPVLSPRKVAVVEEPARQAAVLQAQAAGLPKQLGAAAASEVTKKGRKGRTAVKDAELEMMARKASFPGMPAPEGVRTRVQLPYCWLMGMWERQVLCCGSAWHAGRGTAALAPCFFGQHASRQK